MSATSALLGSKDQDTPQDTPQDIPDWMFEKIPCGCFSYVVFMWSSNVLCFFFHFFLAVITVLYDTFEADSNMNTPRLTLYMTNLTWVPDSVDALVPQNVPGEPISLAWLTFSFFALSASAHFIIVVCNFPSKDLKKKKILSSYGGVIPINWYYKWIYECYQPLRWVEYSFSASVMIIVIAVASGVNHLYMVIAIFVLMFTTMWHGHFAEIFNRPEDVGEGQRRWKEKNRLVRLYPHLLGWVPYSTVWTILMHSFYSNVSGEQRKPPGFVYVIVWSQCIIFTIFGFTQVILLLKNNGPMYYVWGEWTYLLFSIVAKGVLGVTLLVSVFEYESLVEASLPSR